MPQQIKRSYSEARVDLSKMTFTPDVPSAALGANEYNYGKNVETDVRGIRSISGDDPSSSSTPGIPTFVTGGFRQPVGDEVNNFFFITANEDGEWWCWNGYFWEDISPVQSTGSYTQAQNITEGWSGTVPVFNDEQNPPMFWPEDSTRKSITITGASGDGTTSTLTFAAQSVAPWSVGDTIVVKGILPSTYQGIKTVSACTTTSVSYLSSATGSQIQTGLVSDPQPKMKMYSNIVPIDIYDITQPTVDTREITFYGVAESTGSTIVGTTLTIGALPVGTIEPGMFLQGTGFTPGTKIIGNIAGAGAGSTWTVNIPQTSSGNWDFTRWQGTPFVVGETVALSNVQPRYYNGTWEVVASDYYYATIKCSVSDAYLKGGTIASEYTWNWNPDWSSVYAKWLRIYNTPNVGSILVAGNLVATNAVSDDIENYPVTAQWSQSFGLNQMPSTWTPTVTNIANQLEVPLRGESLDAFPCNGNLFLCSYWDTVVFSPLNYATTNTPILGVRLFNQGRGLLSSNCWANTDQRVYGVDARDIWVFDGNSFQSLGNQRVKNWFYEQIDEQYYDRIFMEVNTAKNQIEIYYPDLSAADGVPNKMLSYRYDLDCWNAPRDVDSATFACEAPRWTTDKIYLAQTPISTSGSGTGAVVDIKRTFQDYYLPDGVYSIIDGGSGYAHNDTITFSGQALGGTTPANDCVATVGEVDVNGKILTIKGNSTGAIGGTPARIWSYDNASRCVVYARGFDGRTLLQKDIGFDFASGLLNAAIPIESNFRKDNIKFSRDYSDKVLVHRILPEVVNLNKQLLQIDPITEYYRIGTIDITLGGANSVGQAPVENTTATVATDTDDPWVQIAQNAHRVNTLEVSTTQDRTIWMLTALTAQITNTEDDR